MRLHQISIHPSHFFIWLDVESRTTWRAHSSHIWEVPYNDRMQTVEEWNTDRPPASLCGYRPRRRTMNLSVWSFATRCPDCRRAARDRGIISRTYTEIEREMR